MLIYTHKVLSTVVTGSAFEYSSPDLYRELGRATTIVIQYRATRLQGATADIRPRLEESTDGKVWTTVVDFAQGSLAASSTLDVIDATNGKYAVSCPLVRLRIEVSVSASSCFLEVWLVGRSRRPRLPLEPVLPAPAHRETSLAQRAMVPSGALAAARPPVAGASTRRSLTGERPRNQGSSITPLSHDWFRAQLVLPGGDVDPASSEEARRRAAVFAAAGVRQLSVGDELRNRARILDQSRYGADALAAATLRDLLLTIGARQAWRGLPDLGFGGTPGGGPRKLGPPGRSSGGYDSDYGSAADLDFGGGWSAGDEQGLPGPAWLKDPVSGDPLASREEHDPWSVPQQQPGEAEARHDAAQDRKRENDLYRMMKEYYQEHGEWPGDVRGPERPLLPGERLPPVAPEDRGRMEVVPPRGGGSAGSGPPDISQPGPDGTPAWMAAFARWLIGRLGHPVAGWPTNPAGGGPRVRPGREPDASASKYPVGVYLDVSLNDAPSRQLPRTLAPVLGRKRPSPFGGGLGSPGGHGGRGGEGPGFDGF